MSAEGTSSPRLDAAPESTTSSKQAAGRDAGQASAPAAGHDAAQTGAPAAEHDVALPPAPTTTAGAQIRRFLGTITLRQAIVLYAEEWIGSLLRGIPSMLGFALRAWFYRLLFAHWGGFGFICRNVNFIHSYGIRIGRNYHINTGCLFDGRGGLTIGDNVLIGPNVVIVSSQHHWSDPSLPIIQQGHRSAPIVIGDDVWIGANSVVTPGVTIATGTVVGSGSVVTKSTEPYTIVAGVPARVIGRRERPPASATASDPAAR
ncbi:MAG TPA: DapH/DapD/GlmU-related protein [Candidatus Binatia bacterium]